MAKIKIFNELVKPARNLKRLTSWVNIKHFFSQFLLSTVWPWLTCDTPVRLLFSFLMGKLRQSQHLPWGRSARAGVNIQPAVC